MISHELRNSLCVVRNAACLLRRDNGIDGIDRARVLIERHVSQMNRHVQDLLDTPPPGRQKETLRLAHVDLRTVLQHCVDSAMPDLMRRGHRLVVTLPTDALWLYADGARLEQVFSNLLNNAAKYTHNGGHIELVAERADGHVKVSVCDSGIGIEPALLLNIFDLFVQEDAAAPLAEGGRGIGLAVVRAFVQMHGGTVAASSAGRHSGSEFSVQLPALWANPEAHAP